MTMEFAIDRRLMLAGMGALLMPLGACKTGGGGSAIALTNTQALLDQMVDGKQLVHFEVGVAAQGRAAQFIGKGNLAADSTTAVGPDSIYRVYSMSKPITGAAFMRLVQDGVLSLDQPIADILPEFSNPKVMIDGDVTKTRPAAGPILMRHLITHTSGLSYAISRGPLAEAYNRYGLTPGSREVAGTLAQKDALYPPARDLETFGRRLALLPLDFDPGTKWQYSVGLDLMGLIIQRASGMPFIDYLKQTIFMPLGMNDTDFVVPGSKVDRLTSVYSPASDGSGLTEIDDHDDSPFHRDRDVPSGGGGLVSTAQDYIKFCQMLMNGGELDGVRVLNADTVAKGSSNLMDPGIDTSATFAGANNGFGAAVQVLGAASPAGEGKGTFGWDGAAGTTMWIDPVNKVCAVGMIQNMGGGANIHQPLREALYKDLGAAGLLSA